MAVDKVKAKKWIIVLAVLVLIAIVVTLVVVLLPKNTQDVIRETNTQTESMYLKKDGTEKAYKQMQERISVFASITEEYGGEVQGVYTLCHSLNLIMEFYNSYLVYAEDNSTFQGEYNNIMKNFNTASTEQKKMEEVIDDALIKLGTEDSGFFKGAWNSFKSNFTGYLSSYTGVIKSLNKVYQACVPQGVLSNSLTRLTLNTIDDYLEVIEKDFTKALSHIVYLDNFLEYIKDGSSSVMAKFTFSSSLQEKYQKINSFDEVYENASLKSVIESISSTGFTFAKDANDSKNLLELCEEYLRGGLVA